ncbi:MAG: hypothetical protein ACOY94_22320 [Bacillota bacterium]
MRTWWKQLVPFLILFSVGANLFLVGHIYQRDDFLNRYTWGNGVDAVWKAINWASLSMHPYPEGAVIPPRSQGVEMATESLEWLRSLPHYNKRVDGDDMRTLLQFLRYADQVYTLSAKEQSETGTLTPESALRLARVKEGLEMILHQQDRTNRFKVSRNPWNHDQWRSVWQEIAEGLRQIEFVPLPQ